VSPEVREPVLKQFEFHHCVQALHVTMIVVIVAIGSYNSRVINDAMQ